MRRWLAAILFALVGCAHEPSPANWPAAEHVIAVNEKGETVDPARWPKTTTVEQFHQQMADLSASIDRFHQSHPNQPKKILVFVHGGLTPPEDTIPYAQSHVQQIEDAGYYPIFVVWNPELSSSYGEHLTKVRQGRYEAQSSWLAPFYLIADLGRAVTRLPITWTFQIKNDWGRQSGAISSIQHKDASKRWLDNPSFASSIVVTDELIKRYNRGPTTQMAVSLGPTEGNPSEAADYVGTYVFLFPFKFAVSPVLDGAGSAAWDNMYRRANVLFDGFSAADLKVGPNDAGKILDPGDGAMIKLLRLLESKSTADDPCEITLVGHSMGSIVLNELVRRSVEYKVQYSNIVYMAAACSVRDFQRSVIPYLERHKRAKFYNLCLHPVNELRERHAADLVPRGSLLVWIDDMYSNPHTPLDRTLGRWENIVGAAYVVPDEVKRRVALKGFPCYLTPPVPERVPQMHGDFSSMPYWDPTFWQPDSPEVATKNNAPVAQKSFELRDYAQRRQKSPATTRATTHPSVR